MKRFKGILALSLVLIFAFSVIASAFDFPEPTNDFFVNDFAGVIDSEDEEAIMSLGAELYTKTSAQVVVVTVDSLDGYAVNDYALELGREWGVGDSEKDNGVVLLLAISERQVTIQVGYGLEGCLPDGKTGRILDNYAIPYLKNDDFSTGLTEAYKAIISVVSDEYGVETSDGSSYYIDENEYEYVYADDDFFEDDVGELISTIIIIIVLIIIFIGRRRRRILVGPFFGGPSSFGGSHFGGGSHGGGFSGGGGSFGGGGSSRGF